MKRIIPFLFSLMLLPVFIQAQVTITVDPATFVMTGNPSQTDVLVHVHVTNTSNLVANIFWSRRMTNNPVSWFSWICDKNFCFDPSVNACPTSKPNVINPGESFDVQIHLNPSNTEGTGDYEVNLFDADGNPLAQVTGQVVISNTTAVKDAADTKLTVYPNPTSDYFQVSETPGLKYIELFNIVGNKVRSFDALPQKQYAVGDLADGIYLVRLMTSTGKVIKTIRLSKR